jgi:hypothetical protein
MGVTTQNTINEHNAIVPKKCLFNSTFVLSGVFPPTASDIRGPEGIPSHNKRRSSSRRYTFRQQANQNLWFSFVACRFGLAFLRIAYLVVSRCQRNQTTPIYRKVDESKAYIVANTTRQARRWKTQVRRPTVCSLHYLWRSFERVSILQLQEDSARLHKRSLSLRRLGPPRGILADPKVCPFDSTDHALVHPSHRRPTANKGSSSPSSRLVKLTTK